MLPHERTMYPVEIRSFTGHLPHTYRTMSSDLRICPRKETSSRQEGTIWNSGYVVRTLEAALWAFGRSASFEEGCLMVANLGDDADTVAAVYGQVRRIACERRHVVGWGLVANRRLPLLLITLSFCCRVFPSALGSLPSKMTAVGFTSIMSLTLLNNRIERYYHNIMRSAPWAPKAIILHPSARVKLVWLAKVP